MINENDRLSEVFYFMPKKDGAHLNVDNIYLRDIASQ